MKSSAFLYSIYRDAITEIEFRLASTERYIVLLNYLPLASIT